jgi:hypothetical protein
VARAVSEPAGGPPARSRSRSSRDSRPAEAAAFGRLQPGREGVATGLHCSGQRAVRGPQPHRRMLEAARGTAAGTAEVDGMAGSAWKTALGERTFVWRRANPLKDWYVLRGGGGQALARLSIGGPPFVLARLESDGLPVVFTSEWAEHRRIRIADADRQQVVATYERRWSGRTGTVQFATGGQLEWRRAGWRRADHVFTDRFGNPLLRFDPAGNVTSLGLGAELEPQIGSWQDLVVLLALGWLLLVVAGAAAPPTPALRAPGAA